MLRAARLGPLLARAARPALARAAPAARVLSTAVRTGKSASLDAVEDIDVDSVAYGFMASQALFTGLEVGATARLVAPLGGAVVVCPPKADGTGARLYFGKSGTEMPLKNLPKATVDAVGGKDCAECVVVGAELVLPVVIHTHLCMYGSGHRALSPALLS